MTQRRINATPLPPLPNDAKLIRMTVYMDYIIIATDKGVYRWDEGKWTRIEPADHGPRLKHVFI